MRETDESERLRRMQKTCDLFRLLDKHRLYGLAHIEIANQLNLEPNWFDLNVPILLEVGCCEYVGVTHHLRLTKGFYGVEVSCNWLMNSVKRPKATLELMARGVLPTAWGQA